MKQSILFFVVIVASFIATGSAITSDDETKTLPEVKLTKAEQELYELIMEYRESKGLNNIPLSKSLTYVAQQHCLDSYNNKPDLKPACNLHSWSKKGEWTACCYTPDHKKSQCMWDKPRELTNYTDNGFEISGGSSEAKYNSFVMTPKYALDGWKKSSGHNAVIINSGVWKKMEWKAIGIGIHKGFAHVWFGASEDPDGEPKKAE